ncbi:MAG: PglZ domain-containing protein [Planctomycetota bacterium]
MAVVTKYLVQLIAKQVEDQGLVVWYDPEQAYGSVAAELSLPMTTVARYDGSFLKLRKEIDHLMNDGQPPRLVVYVPSEREKTHAALIELDSAGVIMQPRQQRPACNTRLSVVARNALKPLLGDDQVDEIERQVEAGKLSLADLNSLADKGKDISTGVITLIFGKENETFLCVERSMLTYVESELLQKATTGLLGLAVRRLSRFWADVEPKIQARWALISSAAEVLLEADRVGKEVKKAPTTVPALVKAYADDDQPWCLLDTHHRHMESRKYNFEFAAGNDHQGLEKLITKAEQRYTEVGSELAKHFVTHFAKAKHPIKGLLRQRDFFEKQVKPHLGEGKVAYVWVDALRFEMARELCRLLSDDFTLECQPAIGTMPTITEIGMAALLPKAHEAAKVVGVGGGKLGLEIAGKVIKDRKDRVAFLKEHAGVSVFDAKLDDLLPKPGKKVKDGIQNNQLILITSQEIDELGEADNMAQARLQIDGVPSHLRRGVRVLADHGIKTIVLVADHGHLFADEIGEDMKIEAPGGKVEDLHRRVWVGVGGNSEPSYLRTPLASLGVDSEYDLATPWTFAVFKSKGGGRAHFHGGLSPQELIVPVVVMHSLARQAAPTVGIQWTLKPGTAKLTTRFFSVQIAGSQSQSSLFGFEPPKVRIELRANKVCVSMPVSASYGFEDATGEVKLKISTSDPKRIDSNTVTVMLSEEVAQKTVRVYLLDATTGAELAAPLTIDVAISR